MGANAPVVPGAINICLLTELAVLPAGRLAGWRALLSWFTLLMVIVDPGFPFRLTPMSFALRVTNSL